MNVEQEEHKDAIISRCLFSSAGIRFELNKPDQIRWASPDYHIM